MPKPIIFRHLRLPWECKESIRICLPGIDRGGAVHFEAEFDLSAEEVDKLLPKIKEALKNVEILED
jgi:hypothetical protein